MPRSTPARPALLRSLNDRTVLDVLLARGPSSRSDLAEATGLSKPTVAEALARLEDARLIADAGETVGRRGPNGRLYDVVVDHVRGAALTVEPNRIACDVLDARGSVLGSATRTRADLPRGAAAAARALVADACAAAGIPLESIRELVIAVPGSYDAAGDRIKYADRIPDWTVPGIAAAIVGAFDHEVAVTLDNDVNLALVAERAAGDDGADVTSLLWLSSGIGLATDMAGTLYRGVSGGAGEIGYIPLPARGPRGGRASHPDFQDLVGGTAVLALAREHGISARTPAAAVERAVALLGSDDPTAAGDFLDELAARIALGLAVIVAVLDPGAVLLGGAVGRAGGRPLAVRTSRALRSASRLACAIVPSTVDGEPALVGAGRAVTDRLQERVLAAADAASAAPLPVLPHQTHRPLSRTAEEVH